MIGIRTLLEAGAKSKLAKALKSLVPAPLWAKFRDTLVGLSVSHSTDRHYLERTILPTLGHGPFQKVLFIGCESYTENYTAHFAAAAEYWTTDIRPEAAPFGAPDRHVTCDVKAIDRHFAKDFAADLVLFNGVFGYGVNTDEDMDASLRAVHRIMKPGGILMLGWNNDLSGDPAWLTSMSLYRKVADGWMLPPRVEFDDSTHIFAFFES